MQGAKRPRAGRRSAFSTFDVVIVVGIILGLVALAVFVVPRSETTTCSYPVDLIKVDDGGSLATQLEIYRAHIGRYPEELRLLLEKPEGREADKWRGPYINDTAKLKDSWGRELKYRCPGRVRKDSYDLWSVGKDGLDQTADDASNFRQK